MHPRSFRPPGPLGAADTERAKTAPLRKLRLASEAGGREGGTRGAASVGEIRRGATGATFVFSRTGRGRPVLEDLAARHAAGMMGEEYQFLAAWVMKHRRQGFDLAILAWNLRTAEAGRDKQLRIAGHKAAGRAIINDLPGQAAP